MARRDCERRRDHPADEREHARKQRESLSALGGIDVSPRRRRASDSRPGRPLRRRWLAAIAHERRGRRGSDLPLEQPDRGGARARGGAGVLVLVGQFVASLVQRSCHRPSVAVALGGILAQGALDDLDEHLRRVVGERRRFVLEVAQRKFDDGLGLERWVPGEHLVEHDARAIDVGRGAAELAVSLLGRHVPGRADDRRGTVAVAVEQSGDPEVADFHLTVGGDQHVGGLDVAVHDPPGVRGGERPGELLGDLTRLDRADGTPAQALGEADAVDELGDVVETLRCRADVEDLNDARVVDRREQLHLALEAVDPLRVLGPPRLDHFDGDASLQPAVATAVHTAERALADQGMQLVSPIEGDTGQIGSTRR